MFGISQISVMYVCNSEHHGLKLLIGLFEYGKNNTL
jgi:hypothetical protein